MALTFFFFFGIRFLGTPQSKKKFKFGSTRFHRVMTFSIFQLMFDIIYDAILYRHRQPLTLSSPSTPNMLIYHHIEKMTIFNFRRTLDRILVSSLLWFSFTSATCTPPPPYTNSFPPSRHYLLPYPLVILCCVSPLPHQTLFVNL